MGEAARTAGVPIITGDTKVVERGKADGVFISTAGVGVVPHGLDLSAENARAGDRVLISGTLGDHGVAIMSKRQNLAFDTEIVSDSAALHDLVATMVEAGGRGIRLMRDPTRGGLAATLNEIAQQSDLGFHLREEAIPVKPGVAAACELLGLDPLHVANEGKLVAIVAPELAGAVLAAMRAHPLGRDAAEIGDAVADDHHFVQMATSFGGGTDRRLAVGRAIAENLLGPIMRILLLSHSFNSLTQRLHVELQGARPRRRGRARHPCRGHARERGPVIGRTL